MSENYYLQNYKNNSKNLRSGPNYCKKAQKRYKLHPNHYRVLPTFKYLAYEQCLPGCVVKKNYTSHRKVTMGDGSTEDISLTSDTKCEAYDTKETNCTQYSHKLPKESGNLAEDNENSHNQGRQKLFMTTRQFKIPVKSCEYSFPPLRSPTSCAYDSDLREDLNND